MNHIFAEVVSIFAVLLTLWSTGTAADKLDDSPCSLLPSNADQRYQSDLDRSAVSVIPLPDKYIDSPVVVGQCHSSSGIGLRDGGSWPGGKEKCLSAGLHCKKSP